MKEAAMSTFSYLPSSFRPIPVPKLHESAPAPHQSDAASIVGDSAAIKRLRLQVRRIGPHFRTVLITGEPGTGKQTVARALHHANRTTTGPFIASASGNRIGYLMKLAQQGTLFFDRIHEMPLDTQDELLELLRRNEWSQNGLAAPQRMHPRIIASTDQDLRAHAAAGQFRNELYQRLAMVQISLSPLRERLEDIPALAAHLLAKSPLPYRQHIIVASDAMDWLKSYAWPENVRELENILQNAALQTDGNVIRREQLHALTQALDTQQKATNQGTNEPERLQDVIEHHVLHVLKNCAGNKLRAAEVLGISRSTLYRMLDLPAQKMQDK